MVNVTHKDAGAELTQVEDNAVDRHILTVSTTPGDAVILDGSGRLPAVNGSQLTNINADQVVAGSTNKVYTAAEKAKLAGITAGADVTPLVDEDDMASNSAILVPSQQSVKAYVSAMGGGIGTPVFLAAYDATTKEKAWAIATSGYVCTGTNDEAKWALAQTAAGVGGLVNLSQGSFNVQANITLTALFRGVGGSKDGDSGTRIYISASITITFGHHGNLQDLYYEMASTHAGVGVLCHGEVGFAERPDLMRGVFGFHKGLDNASFPAGSILFQVYAVGSAGAGNKYIQTCHFGPFILRGADIGLKLYSNGDGTGNGWITDNVFDGIIHQNGTASLYLFGTYATGYGATQINKFYGLGMEAYSGASVDGIVLDGVTYNTFDISTSDWGLASGALIHAINGGAWNDIKGNLGGGLMTNKLLVDTCTYLSGTNTLTDIGVSYQSTNFTQDQSCTPPFEAAQWGETVAYGQMVYQSTDGLWYKGDCSNAAKSGGVRIAMVVGSMDAANAYTVNKFGWIATRDSKVRYDTWSWATAGLPLYLSTAGALTATKPTTSGYIQRIAAYSTYSKYVVLACSDSWVTAP